MERREISLQWDARLAISGVPVEGSGLMSTYHPTRAVLNAGRPRLKVEADGEGSNRMGRLYDEMFILPGLLIIVAATFIFLSGTKSNAEASADIEIPAAYSPGLRKTFSDGSSREGGSLFPSRAGAPETAHWHRIS